MSSRVVCILQPGYLPWLGFFEQMHRADVFVYYDDVQFDKGGWRNRNRIKTPNGPQWLTVPVKAGLEDRILEVKIAPGTNWAKKHVKTIRQNYAKAAYFSDYAPALFELLERDWDTLLDLDCALVDWMRGIFGITTPMLRSSEMKAQGRGVERLIGLIHELDGTAFYEGAAGRDYIDGKDFENAGIDLIYQDYDHPCYPQCHGEFISHLSALDLLLNCGPESLDVITRKERS